MIGATHEEIVPRTLHDAGGHAIRRHEGVDHHWPARSATGIVPDLGIDFIDAANVCDGNGICVGQQQVSSVWIPSHSPQPCRGYGARAVGTGSGLAAKCPQGLIDNGAMMAGDVV